MSDLAYLGLGLGGCLIRSSCPGVRIIKYPSSALQVTPISTEKNANGQQPTFTGSSLKVVSTFCASYFVEPAGMTISTRVAGTLESRVLLSDARR